MAQSRKRGLSFSFSRVSPYSAPGKLDFLFVECFNLGWDSFHCYPPNPPFALLLSCCIYSLFWAPINGIKLIFLPVSSPRDGGPCHPAIPHRPQGASVKLVLNNYGRSIPSIRRQNPVQGPKRSRDP